MNIITYPERNTWADLLKRPTLQTESLRETVLEILNRIKFEGDKAVLEYEEKFDKVRLNSLLVSEEEIAEAEKKVSIELKAAITLAYNNIRTFHAAQVFQGKKITTLPGVTCWQKAVAIEKVGLYIPGGTAPLFSTVLMLATPAQIAGCKEIILCTPPDKEGKIHPAILYAANWQVSAVSSKPEGCRLSELWPMVQKAFPKYTRYSVQATSMSLPPNSRFPYVT